MCRAPGRLWTGVSVGRGFRPGRLVSRSADGQTRHEWACRGSVLEHLLAIREWALDRAWVLSSPPPPPRPRRDPRPAPPPRREPSRTSSSPFPRDSGIAVASSRKTRARARAVVAVFGHALCDWDNLRDNLPAAGARSSASATSAPRAGFCGVIGCDVHDPRRGRRGTLKTALENLRPPTPSPRNVEPEIPGFPCPADLGDDVADRVASFLDARGAAALAATCGGMRDRMDARAAGLALRLHPHQRAGLIHPRRRERPVGSASNPPIVDPRWTGPIRTRDERAPYWLNTVTGELCTTAPPSYPDAPGGLLCDEPGLGKTVTALALTLAREARARLLPQGCRARTCEKTGGWYYVARPRLGDGDGDAAAGVRVGTPDGTSDGEVGTPGDAKERRRSKRSRSSTPVGHFAAMERAAFECINPSAKRRKSSASFVRDSEVDRSGDFSPAAPSRLGPRFAEAPTSADEEKKIKIEWSANVNEPGPPKGFRPLRASAARAATERATSQRNVAHFQTALASARRAVGSSAVEETCEFVLMNRGGAGPITADDPLLLPKWRFNGDLAEKALAVLYALRTRAVRGRTHAEGLGVGSPRENASAARREPGRDDENDDANDDADVAFAFDAESLDEAISLDRGGGVEGAEVWLSSATLVPAAARAHHALVGTDRRSQRRARRTDRPCASSAPSTRSETTPRERSRSTARTPTPIDGCSASRERLGTVRRSERADGGLSASSSASAWTGGGCSKSTRARQRHDALPSFDGLSPRVLASRWDVVLIPVNRLSAEFSRVDSPLRARALATQWCSTRDINSGARPPSPRNYRWRARSGRTPDG